MRLECCDVHYDVSEEALKLFLM